MHYPKIRPAYQGSGEWALKILEWAYDTLSDMASQSPKEMTQFEKTLLERISENDDARSYS